MLTIRSLKLACPIGCLILLHYAAIVGSLPVGVRNQFISSRSCPMRPSTIISAQDRCVVSFRRHSRGLVTRLNSSSNDLLGSFLSRRNILAALGGLFLGLPPILEVYSRLGTSDSDFSGNLLSSPTKGSWEEVQYATLVFHGAGGQDKFTDALMSQLEQSSSDKSSYSSIIDWSNFSTNILQASFNGQRLGRKVVEQLVKRAPNLKSVHVIGISVGAFVADSVSKEIKTKDSPPYVQLTLLDPFTQRGIFDVGYGAREYGKSADYFQQYLNTDDPVPSTNTPLPNSVCYDITAIRPDDVSFGHDWPVAYYARKGNVGIVPPEEQLERGTIVNVEW